jgi:hypothetical protein
VWVLTFVQFFEKYIFGLLQNTVEVLILLDGTKNGLGHILGDFFKNSSRHPGHGFSLA